MNCRSRNVPNALNAAGTIKRCVRIEQMQLHHECVIRDHRDDAGNHQRAEIEQEDRIPASPVQAGKCKAAIALVRHVQKRHPQRDEHAVEVIDAERNLLEDIEVVSRMPSLGEKLSSDGRFPEAT